MNVQVQFKFTSREYSIDFASLVISVGAVVVTEEAGKGGNDLVSAMNPNYNHRYLLT